MKKIFLSALLLLGGLCGFTSCEDDNDSNPVIQTPTTFVLNTPSYANEVIYLASSEALHFTWSQPDYGFPVVAAYYFQFSTTGNFTTSFAEASADETGQLVADYIQADGGVTTCKADAPAADVAKMLQQLCKWEENAVPEVQEVYVRVLANIPVSGGAAPSVHPITSNPVKIKVAPYYVELKDAPIELWYLIGACIGDGSWSNSADAVGKAIYPLATVPGYEYDKKTGQGELTFTGYLTTDGFKMIHTPGDWNEQWGQGASFGEFVKNDGGSGNITVPENGYYTITLNTATDKLTVTKADITPAVYTEMYIVGAFNEWNDTGNPMTPVNTAVTNNHIWSYQLEVADATEVKFTQAGWSTNWGGANFPYGVGENNGPNIAVPQGSYTVIFNDIDGSYQFLAK